VIAGYQGAFVGVILTDMRHKCLLCDQEIVHIITLGLDPHPGSHTVVAHERCWLFYRRND
jgi:hypothetical protein